MTGLFGLNKPLFFLLFLFQTIEAQFFFSLSLDFSKSVPIVSRIKMTEAESTRLLFLKPHEAGQNTSASSGFDMK
jgi:hypothetical protein